MPDEIPSTPATPTQELRSGRPSSPARLDASDPAPDLLDARYELRRRIGSGGMADVYLARDRTLERDVAIKLLRSEARAEHGVERFVREALVLAAIESPHVAAIHDVCVQAHRAYLVMRYVAGETLEELLADGPLAPRRAVAIIAQVLDALGTLHEHRIVHRDVKPANVVIGADDHVTLVDLGVARDRRRRALTPANATLGTLAYMAPEHREANHADPRSDLFQVGLLTLYAIAGTDPAHASSPYAMARLLEQVPPSIATVIERALHADPLQRYTCAREMRNALIAAAGDQAR